MTPRQQQALQFITDYIGERGLPPSYAEIAGALGIASRGNIHRILWGLIDRGLLIAETDKSGAARNFRPVTGPSDYQRGYRDGFAAGQVKQSSSMCV